jgi:hypothetical protein
VTNVCALLERPPRWPPLILTKHQRLHPEGHRLIASWFEKAWHQRQDDEETFESFIFTWFAVNGWAACVTGVDADREYIARLSSDDGLYERFAWLLAADTAFSAAARRFHAMWPIFKAQRIRREGVQPGADLDRAGLIEHYLDAGLTDYAPACWQAHRAAGEPVPLDWPHTLEAIYRVRCNLFHGEKSAHSEMDRAIVRAAFETLLYFFRGAQLL